MITSTFKTKSYDLPLKNNSDTLNILKAKTESCLPQKISIATTTMVLAALLSNQTVENDPKRIFPTAYTIAPTLINSTVISNTQEPFIFQNRDEILKYIKEKPSLLYFYKSLPTLIERTFGDVKTRLSIFKDNEENWSNLRIEIDSQYNSEKTAQLENEFFALVENDRHLVAAFDYVTISFG